MRGRALCLSCAILRQEASDACTTACGADLASQNVTCVHRVAGLETLATAGPCSTDEKLPALKPCVATACPPGQGYVSVPGMRVTQAIGGISGQENGEDWLP